MSDGDPWTGALQSVWAEVEQGQIPPDEEYALKNFRPPAPRPGMTEQELRDGILQSVRGAVGEYALMLRHYRWARRHRGWEMTLPTSPRKMAEILIGPTHDPVLARPIAAAIVQRIGELVG